MSLRAGRKTDSGSQACAPLPQAAVVNLDDPGEPLLTLAPPVEGLSSVHAI